MKGAVHAVDLGFQEVVLIMMDELTQGGEEELRDRWTMETHKKSYDAATGKVKPAPDGWGTSYAPLTKPWEWLGFDSEEGRANWSGKLFSKW